MVKANIGETVRIGDVDYIIAHIDVPDRLMYLIKKYWDKNDNTVYDNNSQSSYKMSMIKLKCEIWYQKKIPESIKPLLVTLDCGYGCPVFIPTLAQVASITDIETVTTVVADCGNILLIMKPESSRMNHVQHKLGGYKHHGQDTNSPMSMCAMCTRMAASAAITPITRLGFDLPSVLKWNSWII